MLVLPLTDEAYEAIKSGRVIDVDYLEEKHVLPYVRGKNKLYASSLVIDPDYQGYGCGEKLTDYFFQELSKKEEQGIITESILADTVSNGGYNNLSKRGLNLYKKTNHQSIIVERRHETTIEFTIEEYYDESAPRGKGHYKKDDDYRYIEEDNNRRK